MFAQDSTSAGWCEADLAPDLAIQIDPVRHHGKGKHDAQFASRIMGAAGSFLTRRRERRLPNVTASRYATVPNQCDHGTVLLATWQPQQHRTVAR
jgi:hypothetical protein